MRYYVAPMEGITTWLFRGLHHRLFGGADRYYMPFFSPAAEHRMTARELRDLSPEHNEGVPAVPQVMTRKAEDFLWAAGELAAMGYREINLNLGCPSGTVAAKGKGAGFLARPEELDAFLDRVFTAAPDIRISVKTRLGIRQPEEFQRLLEIYNRYPLAELTIHPRVQKDFYKYPVRREAFAAALEHSRNPVCYNGDLMTAEDCAAFARRFPSVEAVMLGRGVIADPALLRKLSHGGPAGREELRTFTDALYQGYRHSYGDGPAAQRMKELWFYLLGLFADADRYAKKMRRLSSPREYEALAAGIFRDLAVLPAVPNL